MSSIRVTVDNPDSMGRMGASGAKSVTGSVVWGRLYTTVLTLSIAFWVIVVVARVAVVIDESGTVKKERAAALLEGRIALLRPDGNPITILPQDLERAIADGYTRMTNKQVALHEELKDKESGELTFVIVVASLIPWILLRALGAWVQWLHK